MSCDLTAVDRGVPFFTWSLRRLPCRLMNTWPVEDTHISGNASIKSVLRRLVTQLRRQDVQPPVFQMTGAGSAEKKTKVD